VPGIFCVFPERETNRVPMVWKMMILMKYDVNLSVLSDSI
jgi:hypothetical protein